jgi:antitoxin (DNA-binding transcriptional repressor) of toxin-antitoxin stability system
MWHILWHIESMQSINLRQLRDTRQLQTWLEAGVTVEIRNRNSVIGRIVPEKSASVPVKLPDAAARRRRIFGDRVLPGADLLIEDREKSRY